jgi:DNA polymerase-4
MYGLNTEESQIIFCDLNSAFAMAEQQAHPSLRGRPVGITNRLSKNCCVIAASYEAKNLGVKPGSRLQDALAICPGLIMLESDPPKYHYMYQQIAHIMKSYSPNVKMKSIDEGVVDLRGTMNTVNRGRSLEEIGYEIKQRFKESVGGWAKVNVGIGPNRFLAKQAAGWHKPDGLDRIDHRNLLDYYQSIKLTELAGIASHYEARLGAAGIFTPMEFLAASGDILRRQVFHSVIGEDWAQRLRGYEVDNVETKLGNIGRQWVLSQASADDGFLLPCLKYLSETTGKKLRYQNVNARGVLVWARFQTGDGWYTRKMFKSTFFTDKELYRRALYLFNQRPKHMIISCLGITCYQLTPSSRSQISLLEEVNKDEWLTTAIDEINDRYGTFKIFSANALMGTKLIKQKIPFGGTQYFELLLHKG